jgi:hypothetical protein
MPRGKNPTRELSPGNPLSPRGRGLGRGGVGQSTDHDTPHPNLPPHGGKGQKGSAKDWNALKLRPMHPFQLLTLTPSSPS